MSLFGKSPNEMVYDLIVAKNPLMTKLNVTIDKVIFGTPAHIADSDTTDEETYGRLNTYLEVSGVTDKNVIGTVELKYRRIYIDHLFAGRVVSVDGYKANSTLDLLPLLQEKYGIVIPASDVRSSAVSGESATLTFNGSSLAWIGSLKVFLTDMNENTSDLTQVIKTTSLDGLSYEESQTDVTSAQ
ncbi:hypothetical protein pEaSNUABM6_00254 [Erwinia phage pEa_SNUABM_6]|nr:hypothetical protein pEaSNUABM6_00254 [Erwinia phage pEa_SNUABM_6]